jgi:hypothetical protein
MFLYRDVLKKSVSIAWNHKNLWFFGIFASLLGGLGQYTMSLSNSPEDWSANIFSALATFFENGNGDMLHNWLHLFQTNMLSAAVLTLFIILIAAFFLFLLWLAVVSQIGLFNNAAMIIRGGSRREAMPIKHGIQKGNENFWPVLCLNILGSALTCFFSALIGLPLVFLTPYASSWVFLLYVLLFLIFIPLSLSVSFFVKYGIAYVVIKDRKFVDSLKDGFRLFNKYWLISLEMALILFIIDFLSIFFLAVSLMALAIPYIFATRVIALSFFVLTGWAGFLAISAAIGIFLALSLLILMAAFLTTFKTAVWTDIFINLVEKKGGTAKLERLAAGLKK